MASRLGLAFVLSSVVLMGCGGASADVRAKVALFQSRANAGQLAEIRREFRLAPSNFDNDMAARAKLGRMIRTTEASVMSGTTYAQLVIVFYNTEFERGHALETFSFRVDGAEPQLERYFTQPGKRMWCPMIALSATSCSTEDVPATLTSSR